MVSMYQRVFKVVFAVLILLAMSQSPALSQTAEAGDAAGNDQPQQDCSFLQGLVYSLAADAAQVWELYQNCINGNCEDCDESDCQFYRQYYHDIHENWISAGFALFDCENPPIEEESALNGGCNDSSDRLCIPRTARLIIRNPAPPYQWYPKAWLIDY